MMGVRMGMRKRRMRHDQVGTDLGRLHHVLDGSQQ